MFLRKAVALVFVLAWGATSALAQQSFTQKIELTPFAGVKVGGKINVTGGTPCTSSPCIDNVLIKSGVDYGGIFDYSLWDNFQFEFLWMRQPTVLSTHDAISGSVNQITTSKLDTYTFGATYAFRNPDAPVKPFITGGIGWTNFTNIHNPNNVDLGFSNGLTYTIGGGAKYYFSRHIGLRADVRYLYVRTTPSSSIQCGFVGCFQVPTHNHANQGAANLGVIVRF